MLHREKTIESESRLENIEEFLSVTEAFEKRAEEEGGETLVSFLTDLALIADIDSLDKQENKSTEKIVLMTMHAAKGLEFPVVFIIGMEENVFPHSRSLGDNEEMEEGPTLGIRWNYACRTHTLFDICILSYTLRPSELQ